MTTKATTYLLRRPFRRHGGVVAGVVVALLVILASLLPQQGRAGQADGPVVTAVLAQPGNALGGHGHAADPACHSTVGCVPSALPGTAVLAPRPVKTTRAFGAARQAPRSLRPAPAIKPPIA